MGGIVDETGGTGGEVEAGGGTGSTGGIQERIPLVLDDGRIRGNTNLAGIEGEVVGDADTHTADTVVETIEGTTACIEGEAFQIDLDCVPTDPQAGDCYGEFWGAALELTLNQPEGEDPGPFDASNLAGFGFNLTGATVPASMRFVVTTSQGHDYCTNHATRVFAGPNSILFEDLVTECWGTAGDPLTDTSSIQSISWQVVTNSTSSVPFQFCVGDLIAIAK